jgi:hypothetical protein
MRPYPESRQDKHRPDLFFSGFGDLSGVFAEDPVGPIEIMVNFPAILFENEHPGRKGSGMGG